MTKKPSTEVRSILKQIGPVQDLIGRARAAHHDDRDPNGHAKTSEALNLAFDAVVEILGQYPPQ